MPSVFRYKPGNASNRQIQKDLGFIISGIKAATTRTGLAIKIDKHPNICATVNGITGVGQPVVIGGRIQELRRAGQAVTTIDHAPGGIGPITGKQVVIFCYRPTGSLNAGRVIGDNVAKEINGAGNNVYRNTTSGGWAGDSGMHDIKRVAGLNIYGLTRAPGTVPGKEHVLTAAIAKAQCCGKDDTATQIAGAVGNHFGLDQINTAPRTNCTAIISGAVILQQATFYIRPEPDQSTTINGGCVRLYPAVKKVDGTVAVNGAAAAGNTLIVLEIAGVKIAVTVNVNAPTIT
jgi:hypothetical protein